MQRRDVLTRAPGQGTQTTLEPTGLLREMFCFLKTEKRRKMFLRSPENSLGVCFVLHVQEPKPGAPSSKGVRSLLQSQVTDSPHVCRVPCFGKAWGVTSGHGVTAPAGQMANSPSQTRANCDPNARCPNENTAHTEGSSEVQRPSLQKDDPLPSIKTTCAPRGERARAQARSSAHAHRPGFLPNPPGPRGVSPLPRAARPQRVSSLRSSPKREAQGGG